jgi:general secretion pathway protein J
MTAPLPQCHRIVPPDREALGFTLVELLIAITLLGLLMVMLFGGLRFGTQATTAASSIVVRTSEIATAYGFLREALGNAQPLPVDDATPQPRVMFDGDADHLEFVALPPGHLAPGDFHRLYVGLDDAPRSNDGGRRPLMLRWNGVPRGPGASEPVAVPPSILRDRVGRVEFAYFGPGENGEPAAWQPRWQAAKSLPDLVRIRITFGDGWKAPELIVAPRLADDSVINP